ncbi:MerR family transcriptional regulator [Paenibacillus mucilaginosus]|uniref:MerR family transcriptional regulator n=2 Tax=Paenibacillus mucilaginosus TaxID=61624 RepID=H6NF27_9BACL|nr:MerR family transcriptional regulator [Paenibacillus mucilaginosus]AEI40417.1 transcriptional regulator, MerR family [Paenibacillus mucilaginosus KNP414]AFC29034.1 MerR family transcriptional regulator [Paenibacillus mucilaginosus 3016]MCG7213238.1 MerR family transcriptional regulator [Paenibacillus mucilaginosus]WDM29596.1 MerR family transcriptional regulator [Paenibacillus mucilaginosus]WFA17774.1 MerR family transcriptional regulator [Paenibacillus mucilaginosus]
MPQHWKVGDLAKLTGLTVRTLRFYDQIGLFSPSGHSDSGHRLYYEADIKKLHQILSLKDLGLSLEEIQSVLKGHTYTPSHIVGIQIERVRKNIKNQQKLLAELERVAEQMDDQDPPSVDEFISLLETMKMNHEKYIIEHRLRWEHHFDQLGDLLSEK